MASPQYTRLLSAAFWKSLLGYIGINRGRRAEPITCTEHLAYFLRTRASHVAQTSLYGYLRTRAGTRFPELFLNAAFAASTDIAKWQVWLACLSDLSIYAGGLLIRRTQCASAAVGQLMQETVEAVLRETGTPAEAGNEFGPHADHMRQRLATCDWSALADDESCFSESPTALVRWAPVVEELKQLDEEIVRNSVRFRWQEVRQDLRRLLDAKAVLEMERTDDVTALKREGKAQRP